MKESLKIVWDGSLATGVKTIDIQHKYLIDIINELAEAIEEGKTGSSIRKILNLLKHYTEWHFGREELCMEKFKCPAAAANKAAHGKFLQTFEGFQEEYRSSGDSEAIALRMYQVLTDWLVSHIQKIDSQAGPCVHRGVTTA
jgi:hemerythrin